MEKSMLTQNAPQQNNKILASSGKRKMPLSFSEPPHKALRQKNSQSSSATLPASRAALERPQYTSSSSSKQPLPTPSHNLSFTGPSQANDAYCLPSAASPLPELSIDTPTYISASIDAYCRTLRNPDIASYALIIGDEAHFYTPPITEKYKPGVKPGTESQPLDSFGKYFHQIPAYEILAQIVTHSEFEGHVGYVGWTSSGKKLFGSHCIDLTLESPQYSEPQPAKMVSFYPISANKTDAYWGCYPKYDALFHFPHCEPPLKPSASLTQEMIDKAAQKITAESPEKFEQERQKELSLKKQVFDKCFHYKGVDEIALDLPSIAERKKITQRNPDQKTVMGGKSSVNEMSNFLQKPLARYLHPDVRAYMERCANAPFKGPGSMWEGQWRGEWLHVVGFGCTPMTMNPQIRENLVSSSKCVNTEQMIVEYILQNLGVMANNLGYGCDDFKLMLKDSFFELIPESQIACYLSFNTRLELSHTRRAIETHQQFSTLNPPPFRHKADVGAGCVIFSKFLSGEKPDHVLKISPTRSALH